MSIPVAYAKRSFLELPVRVDTQRLQQEVEQIPEEWWSRTLWGDIHCSVGTVLLRGGKSGSAEDFFAERVRDSGALKTLPYCRELISKYGPFGQVAYAFLFRMVPGGVTLVHRDLQQAWIDRYRVHIPVQTNAEACLVAAGRSQHFSVGCAWTFDNQSRHGFVNGQTSRTHLIMDVAFSKKLQKLLDGAVYHEGNKVADHVVAISAQQRQTLSYPGDAWVIARMQELQEEGLSLHDIAQQLTRESIPTRTLQPAANGWSVQMLERLSADETH